MNISDFKDRLRDLIDEFSDGSVETEDLINEVTTEAVRLTWEAKMRAALVALAEAESDDAVCVRLRVIASNPSK